MDNIEMINLWKQYDEKLEKSLSLNRKIITELQMQKAKGALKPTKRIKKWAIFIGILYVIFLGIIIYGAIKYHASIFFTASIVIHLLVSLTAIAFYIRQLYLINQIDNSENVIEMQQKLANLKSLSLTIVGISFLQMPVFTTWFITEKWIIEAPLNFALIQVPIVLAFTAAGIWLYKNINIKNIDKKWFKLLFSGPEWNGTIKSAMFLEEIESFKHN